MERVLVVGPCGAGKSTAASKIGSRLGLPVIHLDRLYWQPGWIEPPPDEFAARLDEALNGASWIIDGNYGGSMDLRMGHADTVVYFDFPIPLCLWRTVRRIWTFRGRTRPDVAADCPERLDLSFLWYIAKWPWTKRPALTRRLQAFGGTMHHFRSPAALQGWIDQL